jgi:hypothetical protein
LGGGFDGHRRGAIPSIVGSAVCCPCATWGAASRRNQCLLKCREYPMAQ